MKSTLADEGAVAVKMRFATTDLPPGLSGQALAEAWTQALGATGGQFELRTPNTDDFFGAVELQVLGDLQIGAAMATSIDVVRTDALIARDGDDRVMLIINRSNRPTLASQFGRTVDLPAGAISLFALDTPNACRTPHGGHVIHALIPRRLLGDIDLEAVAARPLNNRCEAAKLLRDLLIGLMKRSLDDETVANATAGYLATLVRAVLAAGQDAATDEVRAVNLVRLNRAKALIASSFGEADLSVAVAARRLGVSTRHLQMLFAAEGETFSSLLSAARLDAAYALLLDPAEARRTVVDIAFACGFQDLSTFYRRFGARYGRTPAQLRAEPNEAR